MGIKSSVSIKILLFVFFLFFFFALNILLQNLGFLNERRGVWESFGFYSDSPSLTSKSIYSVLGPVQTPILIPAELNSKGEKCSFCSNYLQNTL